MQKNFKSFSLSMIQYILNHVPNVSLELSGNDVYLKDNITNEVLSLFHLFDHVNVKRNKSVLTQNLKNDSFDSIFINKVKNDSVLSDLNLRAIKEPKSEYVSLNYGNIQNINIENIFDLYYIGITFLIDGKKTLYYVNDISRFNAVNPISLSPNVFDAHLYNRDSLGLYLNMLNSYKEYLYLNDNPYLKAQEILVIPKK